MKILILLSVLLSQSVFAEIKKGDQATYSLQTQQSANDSVTNLVTVMEIINVDPAGGTVDVSQTIYQNGNVLQQDTHTQALTDLLQVSADQVAHCETLAQADMTVTSEQVKVRAGTFSACHLKSNTLDADGNQSNLYLSNVPFGFVKSVQNNPATGALQSMELTSYRKH